MSFPESKEQRDCSFQKLVEKPLASRHAFDAGDVRSNRIVYNALRCQTAIDGHPNSFLEGPFLTFFSAFKKTL